MPPRVFDVVISAIDWHCLDKNAKCFIVIVEPSPGVRYGDTLRLTCRGSEETLERWVTYIESGRHLLPNSVAIEIGMGESTVFMAQHEACEEGHNTPREGEDGTMVNSGRSTSH